MTGFIFWLTLRQIIGRRSILLLVALAALPVVIATVFRLSQTDAEPDRWTAEVLYLGLIITGVLPLTALLLGTAVIGDEIEDGTVAYLLTKPLRRWQILVAKVTAAWLVIAALTVAAIVASGLIALEGQSSAIVAGFAVAAAAGALAYAVLFVLLSVVTTRALISGLIYVFLWEGAITSIFDGTRYLSVRHYTLGLAEWIAGTSEDVFDAYVGGETALILITLTVALAAYYANRRLEQVEARDAG